jgi:hypothetical protein
MANHATAPHNHPGRLIEPRQRHPGGCDEVALAAQDRARVAATETGLSENGWWWGEACGKRRRRRLPPRHPGANRSMPASCSSGGAPAACHCARPCAVKKLVGPRLSRMRPEKSLPIQISRSDPTKASNWPSAWMPWAPRDRVYSKSTTAELSRPRRKSVAPAGQQTAACTKHQARRTPIHDDRSLLLRPSRLMKRQSEPVAGRASKEQPRLTRTSQIPISRASP